MSLSAAWTRSQSRVSRRRSTRLRDEHEIAILLTDHNVRETLSVTDRSYIIHEGQVIAEGTPRTLINNPRVRETYLGSTFRGDEFDDKAEVGGTV